MNLPRREKKSGSMVENAELVLVGWDSKMRHGVVDMSLRSMTGNIWRSMEERGMTA